MSDRIVTAAVIIIGNEILSGRTQDTNLRDIALSLGAWGIRVAEARMVPDVENVIVATVNELRARHDYVLTTGGLGPTHDDITAACVAKAFGVELVEQPEVAAFVRNLVAPPEVTAARLRMALVPEGSSVIECGDGPPGFFIGNVYVLAGIPDLMRLMLASLEKKLTGGAVVQSRSVTAEVLESTIAMQLESIQARHPKVDVGSYPFVRGELIGTTLVARSTDLQQLDEVVAEIERMLLEHGSRPDQWPR